MANLQGHVTNSRGKQTSAIAHRHMQAMVRTWTGGITVEVDANGDFTICMGPHGAPGQTQVAHGNVATIGLITDKEASA